MTLEEFIKTPDEVEQKTEYVDSWIAKKYNKTIKLGVANYLPSENVNLSKIKHLNRLDQCLTSHELLYKKKIQDLVILHRGNIIECISSNIFFVKNHNNMLIFDTPFINDFGVEGIMTVSYTHLTLPTSDLV